MLRIILFVILCATLALAVPPCTTAANCDDLNACTIDTCNSDHMCVHTPVVCNDHIECTEDICDRDVGCLHIPRSERCPHDEDDRCSVSLCTDDGCQMLEPSCSDGIPCTRDLCEAERGCRHIPENERCNDHNVCTLDFCDPDERHEHEHGCRHRPIECPPCAQNCTVPACDRETGCKCVPRECITRDGYSFVCNPATNACTMAECVNIITRTVTSCDDNDTCTVDMCVGLLCQHTDVDCDDSDPCTVDTCTSGTGCQHAPVVCSGDLVCDDGDCVSVSSDNIGLILGLSLGLGIPALLAILLVVIFFAGGRRQREHE